MGRRRDYEEGYEDARRDMMERETGSRRGGGEGGVNPAGV
jgi:hypothetical protein